jgi:hypothetical protein
MTKIDSVIAGVIKFRDQKDALSKRHKEEMAPLNEKITALENYLQLHLQALGTTSFSVKEVGTAYLQNVVSVTTADWDAILGWIRQNEAWEFLEHRVSKLVVQEYVESKGELPPGVAMTQSQEVRVRRG